MMEDQGCWSPPPLVFRGWQLPPGFRFQPTDQEIIVCYLKKKIAAATTAVTSIIADVDIYKFDPWDLPAKALFGDGEWFFFSPRDRKYPNGARPNRTAGSGYWKATGTDKPILAAGGAHCLGVKKALVFYQGRSPKGTKTHWVMHEYRLLDTDAAKHQPPSSSMRLDDWVLCRVRNKQHGGGAAADDDSSIQASASKPPTAAVRPPHPSTGTGTAAADWWNNTNNNDNLLQYLIAAEQPPAEAEQLVSSVLESIKRNLSFQSIDELYLLQPTTKRANNCVVASMAAAGAGDDDDHHPQISFSISEGDDVF